MVDISEVEHDGGEFFDHKTVTNRADVKQLDKEQLKDQKKIDEQIKEIEQKRWLSPDNPFIWEDEGFIDNDI